HARPDRAATLGPGHGLRHLERGRRHLRAADPRTAALTGGDQRAHLRPWARGRRRLPRRRCGAQRVGGRRARTAVPPAVDGPGADGRGPLSRGYGGSMRARPVRDLTTPIARRVLARAAALLGVVGLALTGLTAAALPAAAHDELIASDPRSEEHTSELQSREKLVCRLLLDKK